MSKYIKLEDAIEAYNQAVTLLVESEMEEFNLGDFTECSFNTTQIKLIARMIESLPTIEVSEDCISREHLEEEYWQALTPKEMVNTDVELGINIGIQKMYEITKNAPSVVPKVNKNEWMEEFSDDGWRWVKDEL